MKIRYIIYWTIFLWALLTEQQLSFAQYENPNTLPETVWLEEVKVVATSATASDFKFPVKEYKQRKLSTGVLKEIRETIINTLRKEGYYLARIDSQQVHQLKVKNRVELKLYAWPGPRFIFHDLQCSLVDSLAQLFKNEIESIVDTYRNKAYTESLQRALFHSIVSLFENNGYPLARIETNDFDIDTLSNSRLGLTLNVTVYPGDQVLLSAIQVPVDSDINAGFLKRIFRFEKNELYREKNIERYQRILQRQDFIRSVNRPELILTKDSSYALNFLFEKAPATSLDGIVGYVPPPLNQPAANGYFTGMFNIGLRNLFGTGRRLDIYWQKPDRYSEEFRFHFREPFLLGLPFHAGGTLHRLVRDTSYIEWEYSVNTEIPLNESLTGNARFYSREVFPDSVATRRLRLPQTRALHTEIGFDWDTRDDFYNPRKGLLFSLKFDFGTQRNVGPYYLLKEDSLIDKTDISRVTGRLSAFLEFFPKQVIALDLNSVLIGYQGQPVRTPDMFWFGGATTLRGYREDQFFAEKAGWVNLEYRFILSADSRLFFFTDLGYYARKLPVEKKEFLTGYGLGIGFPGPLGILQVDYGLAKGLSFSEGKIHFHIINKF